MTSNRKCPIENCRAKGGPANCRYHAGVILGYAEKVKALPEESRRCSYELAVLKDYGEKMITWYKNNKKRAGKKDEPAYDEGTPISSDDDVKKLYNAIQNIIDKPELYQELTGVQPVQPLAEELTEGKGIVVYRDEQKCHDGSSSWLPVIYYFGAICNYNEENMKKYNKHYYADSGKGPNWIDKGIDSKLYSYEEVKRMGYDAKSVWTGISKNERLEKQFKEKYPSKIESLSSHLDDDEYCFIEVIRRQEDARNAWKAYNTILNDPETSPELKTQLTKQGGPLDENDNIIEPDVDKRNKQILEEFLNANPEYKNKKLVLDTYEEYEMFLEEEDRFYGEPTKDSYLAYVFSTSEDPFPKKESWDYNETTVNDWITDELLPNTESGETIEDTMIRLGTSRRRWRKLPERFCSWAYGHSYTKESKTAARQNREYETNPMLQKDLTKPVCQIHSELHTNKTPADYNKLTLHKTYGTTLGKGENLDFYGYITVPPEECPNHCPQPYKLAVFGRDIRRKGLLDNGPIKKLENGFLKGNKIYLTPEQVSKYILDNDFD